MTRRGFTLIELLLVVALIGILSIVGIASFTQATIKSRDTKRKNDLNQIVKALELYNGDVSRYPSSVDGRLTCMESDGSEAVCDVKFYAYVADVKTIYVDELPTDPLAGYFYRYELGSDGNSFSLYTRLENQEDNDVVEHEVAGVIEKTDWGVSCGDGNCNYKLTETGLVRAK